MKVRIGFGLGTRTDAGGPGGFKSMVDGLERRGFDSLWLSERISGRCLDPVVGLSVAAGRTEKLKLGFSVLVLPGRKPAILAKELASLDVLSEGRLLPAFGLGAVDAIEHKAFGVERGERAALFDQNLSKLRGWWAGEEVDGIRVPPKPTGKMEVWLGGFAPSELRRVGRSGDGWLPSFCTPESVAASLPVVHEAAAAAGRVVDDEHIGALVPYLTGGGPVPDVLAAIIAKRNPDADPGRVVPTSLNALRLLLADFVAAGASKFVLVPIADPTEWDAELGTLAEAVLPMQRSLST